MTRGRDIGQATVEFALVLPVVVLLLVGLVQVGRLVGVQVAVTDAARAGARAASVDPRPTVAEAAVRAVLPHADRLVVQVAVTDAHPSIVTVTVSETFRPVGSLAGSAQSTITIRATVSMAVESAFGS